MRLEISTALRGYDAFGDIGATLPEKIGAFHSAPEHGADICNRASRIDSLTMVSAMVLHRGAGFRWAQCRAAPDEGLLSLQASTQGISKKKGEACSRMTPSVGASSK
jgi:hypothetical protein